ncbi:MAG TPA: metallophosphoesterase [Bacillota bacterium]
MTPWTEGLLPQSRLKFLPARAGAAGTAVLTRDRAIMGVPMRILALADLHGNLGALDAILATAPAVDVIVLAGDLTHFGPASLVERVLTRCARHAGRVIAVGGNCDGPAVEARLRRSDVDLHADARVVDGVVFYGVGRAQRWHDRSWELQEDELAQLLEHARVRAGRPPDVLVTHAPPWGVCDRSRSGRPGGSRAVRAAVAAHRPRLVVCGHIHEAAGWERLGASVVVNCGPAAAGMAGLITLDDGVRVEHLRAPR